MEYKQVCSSTSVTIIIETLTAILVSYLVIVMTILLCRHVHQLHSDTGNL